MSAEPISAFFTSDTMRRRLPEDSFFVTATGHYFRNISRTPESSLGVLRISDDGKSAECVWGFNDGGAPTSELASHLMTHIARLSADKEHTAVMHAHPTNIVAMTYVHTLDEKAFTRSLWKRHTECMMVFPEGVAVLPWMLFGCDSLGVAIRAEDARLPPCCLGSSRYTRHGTHT